MFRLVNGPGLLAYTWVFKQTHKRKSRGVNSRYWRSVNDTYF